MEELSQALLGLDYLYSQGSFSAYERAREQLEAQIQSWFPGFTLAYAVEIGTVGAGENTFHHGGVGHVLLPRERR
jgi:hypothetical protein